jgi:16S rRNA (guanine966-N2)-methyltransferase
MFVETGVEGRGLIGQNMETFGLNGVARILRRDATDLGPAGTIGPFDLVFLDPPYARGLGEKAIASAAPAAGSSRVRCAYWKSGGGHRR